jgi:exonuclease SbcC
LVLFEFEVDALRYRVRREFSQPHSRSVATLDFYVFDDVANTFRDLTDKTIRATQEKVTTVLGVDFDTFISSCFFRQGNSDQFSKKTPRDRKLVLAKVLGLDTYDTMHQRANEKAREVAGEKRSLEMVFSRISEEAKVEAFLSEKLTAEKKNLIVIKIGLEEAVKQKKERSLELAKQQFFLEERKALLNQQKNQRLGLKELDEEFSLVVRKWRENHVKILQMPNLELLLREKSIAVKDVVLLEDARSMSFEVEKELVSLKQKRQEQESVLIKGFQEKERSLVKKQDLLQGELSFFRAEKKGLVISVTDLHKKIQDMEMFVCAFITNQKAGEKQVALCEEEATFFLKGKAFYKKMQDRGVLLTKELNLLKAKEKTLAGDSCPLCMQRVFGSCRQNIFQDISLKKKVFEHQLLRIINFLPELKEQLLKQNATVLEQNNIRKMFEQGKLKKELFEKDISIKQSELRSLHQALEDAEKKNLLVLFNVKKLSEQHSKLQVEEKEASVKDKDLFIIAEKIVQLENALKKVVYDKSVHSKLKSRVSFLEDKIGSLRVVEQKKLEQSVLKQQRGKMFYQLKLIKKQLSFISEKLAKFIGLEDRVAKLACSVEDSERNLHSLQEKRLKVSLDVGEAQRELVRIENIKKELEENKKRMQELSSQHELFKTLELAFGSNGIQALLIEDVIPELEDEANKILEMISQTQARVFIESLRDLKKGGTRESLDIKISDINGIRDYEMFSGGEAFRIDFALRVAISKIIAKRAGKKLETLIIDEGFGALDQEGTQVLVDSIYKIMADFRKIIVVSHLVELKDMFPVHFFVEKKGGSSSVKVEFRG